MPMTSVGSYQGSLDLFSRILISRTEWDSKVRGQWKWEKGRRPISSSRSDRAHPSMLQKTESYCKDVRCQEGLLQVW
jgi:hypothetical protein